MISARDARLAHAILHSDAKFREVIEKLQDVSLTFFKVYCGPAMFAGWKPERTDSVL